jgi:hypothetical protein
MSSWWPVAALALLAVLRAPSASPAIAGRSSTGEVQPSPRTAVATRAPAGDAVRRGEFAISRRGGLADTARCLDAARFLRSAPRTVAIVEPDTIDDWRTGRRLGGCRVTAAGITRLGLAGEAVRFFERLRAAGWVRTPDPRDSPNEASLRFRRGETDCVFSVYGDARLGTEAEFAVNDSVTAGTGELRYQVLVLCMRALPARPRDSGGATPPR